MQDVSAYRREANLKWACSKAPFELDLGVYCVAALERFAQGAAGVGNPLPWDVLHFTTRSYGHIGGPSHSNHYTPLREHDEEQTPWWVASRKPSSSLKAEQAERLKAVLRDYPEKLWNSEHARAYANTEPTPEARVAWLGSAADMNPRNLHARCDLAEGLFATGRVAAARRNTARSGGKHLSTQT